MIGLLLNLLVDIDLHKHKNALANWTFLEIVVEMGTHHACDDWDRMIKGDAGMESIYLLWNKTSKGESSRGATGGGDGVHVLTGPIYVEDAEPGDLLMVEIINLVPRPNANGKTFG